MGLSKTTNISLDELNEHVQKAVGNVIVRQKIIGPDDITVGFFPDPIIIGIVIREDVLEKMSAKDLSAVSADVTRELGDFADGGIPVSLIHPGGGTMGYFPRNR